jgi:hypothetical protein
MSIDDSTRDGIIAIMGAVQAGYMSVETADMLCKQVLELSNFQAKLLEISTGTKK